MPYDFQYNNAMLSRRPRILVLTYRMAKGFGVDVVIHQLVNGISKQGFDVAIGCIDVDGFYPKQNIFALSGTTDSVITLVNAVRPDAVLIHTAPFFELLPDLKKKAAENPQTQDLKWIVWEHGDPTPELFPTDQEQRQQEKFRKQQNVYPAADSLVVISDFVGQDIGYQRSVPQKTKIYNGCDHTPDRGPKTQKEISNSSQPLRVGVLTRIGRGENYYKGTERFHVLLETLKAKDIPLRGAFMGGGTPEDARHLIDQGYEVHLNSPDSEKWNFLRGLDIFVSCSRWEGFNLPLVEAQAIGTLSMAFRAGAHSEVCEHIFDNEEQMAEHIARYASDRQALLQDSLRSYQSSRSRFRWETAVQQSLSLFSKLGLEAAAHTSSAQEIRISILTRLTLTAGRTSRFIKLYGVWGLSRRILKRLSRRFR